MKTPEPGIHEDIPMDDYQSWDALSISTLKNIQRSPAYLRLRRTRPVDPTPAMLLGSAIHTCVLEPAQFLTKYYVLPTNDNRTVANRDALEWAEKSGKIPLKPADAVICHNIRTAVNNNETAHRLIQNPGFAELSVLARDIGFERKCRPDYYRTGQIVEFKTTADPRPEPFSRQMHNMGYHMGAAWYIDTMRLAGEDIYDYHIIAVAQTEPHEVYVYDLATEAIDLGRDEYRQLLDRWRICRQTNHYPAGEECIQRLDVPAWAYSRTTDDFALTMGGEAVEV